MGQSTLMWIILCFLVSGTTAFAQDVGKANVFDPDPVTSLANHNLRDDSPQFWFAAAYRQVSLPLIQVKDGTYPLESSQVVLVDVEAPQQAPAVSQDGDFFFERGEAGFNDVMAYYHLSKNVSYLEGLQLEGFDWSAHLPLQVDVHALSGDSGTAYVPSTNQILFGSGCIDAVEDADEIHRIYFHALNSVLNGVVAGGDTGAMVEGMANYWAGARSYDSADGPLFTPYQLFQWRSKNGCREPRRLDALDLVYDIEVDHGSHSRVPGGFSDELWSTPLFQSMIQLHRMGHSRTEFDKFLLEQFSSLEANMKMPAMASQMVFAAEQAFAGGPHALVLFQNFSAVGILRPAEIEVSKPEFLVVGGGEMIEGSTVELRFSLKNIGGMTARDVALSFSAQSQVIELLESEFSVAEISAGDEVVSEGVVRLKVIDEFDCLNPIWLLVTGEYADLQSYSLQDEVTYAGPMDFELQQSVGEYISPGQDFWRFITVPNFAGVTKVSVEVGLQLDHPYIGDMKIDLVHPSGETVVLWNASGGGNDDIRGVFPTTLQPAQSLEVLEGLSPEGDWIMKMRDTHSSDNGTWESWSLKLTMECN